MLLFFVGRVVAKRSKIYTGAKVKYQWSIEKQGYFQQRKNRSEEI